LYVEGDLGTRKSERLEAHLERCERCAATLKALRRSQAVLKETDRIVREDEAREPGPTVAIPPFHACGTGRVFAIEHGRFLLATLAGAAVITILVALHFVLRSGNVPLHRGPRSTIRSAELVRSPVASPIARIAAQPDVVARESSSSRGSVVRPRLSRRLPGSPPAAVRRAEDTKRPPTVVKILTDDPNVVILCIVDS